MYTTNALSHLIVDSILQINRTLVEDNHTHTETNAIFKALVS